MKAAAAAAIRERVERTIAGSRAGSVRRAGTIILHRLDLNEYPDAVDAEPDLDDLEIELAIDQDAVSPTNRERRRARNADRRAELKRCSRTRCAGAACDAVAIGYSGPTGVWFDAMPRPKPGRSVAPTREAAQVPAAPLDWTRIITVDGTEPEIHLCSSCAAGDGLPAGPIHPASVPTGSAAAALVAARSALAR